MSAAHFLPSPVISISFGKNEGKEEVEDDLALVEAVTGNVGHEPMPKL